mmetsp:Transcript_732/g.2047  ORF Transcript_732/g.2047 Transcript_732/m.2047 type:complete len:150 (+) Transcript_732:81-530(+)
MRTAPHCRGVAVACIVCVAASLFSLSSVSSEPDHRGSRGRASTCTKDAHQWERTRLGECDLALKQCSRQCACGLLANCECRASCKATHASCRAATDDGFLSAIWQCHAAEADRTRTWQRNFQLENVDLDACRIRRMIEASSTATMVAGV